MAASSKAEYLKKYLSENAEEKKKKKRRKVQGVPAKVIKSRIVDDDIDLKSLLPENLEDTVEDYVGDNDPTIVEVIDERPEHVKRLEKYRKSGAWKVMNNEDKNNSSQEENNSESDHSSRRMRHDSDSDHLPVRRGRHDSDSDQSPVRRGRHNSNSDQSPVRRGRHDSDSDQSPVRRGRHDSDSDQSPVRRGRHDSDSDQSPPRKQNNLKESKDRHTQFNKSKTRTKSRFSNIDSDESPPRRRRNNSDSDQSPPRRRARNSDSDQSPPRRRVQNSDSDQSPHRKKTVRDKSNIQDKRQKDEKTLSGKRAGLSSAKDMRREAEELRKKENEKFNQISDERLGKDAATVFRDKSSGRKRNLAEEKRKETEESKKKAKEDEKFNAWGKGLKQIEQQSQVVQEALHEANKPLARSRDDDDLDKMLREMDRAEDPMLAFMKKKKKSTGPPVKEKPHYKGPAPPPNRFDILPGYRWDGVNRSNGFEKQIFTKQAEKKATASQAYKWSVEDM